MKHDSENPETLMRKMSEWGERSGKRMDPIGPSKPRY